MSQDASVKEKVRSVSGILKTNLVELNNLQAQIVIIDLKPHQSTHFLYTNENSSMDLPMKSQTSANTSELDHQ